MDTIAVLVGFVMYGALNYLPVFFQDVQGNSPTVSGLKLVPMSFGIIVASMGSGIFITKSGHYFTFVPLGTGIMALAVGVLGDVITVGVPYWKLALLCATLGLGIGLMVQCLVIVIQASVQRNELAITTATQSFLRTMGGSIGVTIFGTVLTNKLSGALSSSLYATAQGGYDVIKMASQEDQNTIFDAYCKALDWVFYSAVPVAGVAFLLTFLIDRVKLPKDNPLTRKPEHSQQQLVEGGNQNPPDASMEMDGLPV